MKAIVVLVLVLLGLFLLSGCLGAGIGGKAPQRMLGVGFPVQECEEKTICFDEFNRVQQFADCSVGEKFYCRFGCIDGSCVNQE